MTEITHAYWKAREGANGEYISGFCWVDNVPQYGEVREVPLPTTIEVNIDENGTLRAYSPPVIGGRKAYRYQMILSAKERAALPSEPGYFLECKINARSVEGPHVGTTLPNWWWYASDDFRPLGYKQKTPLTLAKKWKRGMLEILLEGHPEREAILAEWDGRVAAHKSRVRQLAQAKTTAHKKAHDDLVVIPHPVRFQSDDVKQVFRYNISANTQGRRAKHTLRVSGVDYKIRHGNAMTFKDGLPPEEGLSIPIRAALPLITWANAPKDSAHAIMSAEARFDDLCRQSYQELQAWLSEGPPDKMVLRWVTQIEAAISALSDFASPRQPKEMPPLQRAAQDHVHDLVVKATALLRQVADEFTPKKE